MDASANTRGVIAITNSGNGGVSEQMPSHSGTDRLFSYVLTPLGIADL